MAYIPSSGSVVAFQSQPSSLLAGVSVMGLTPVNITNTPTVLQLAGSVLATSATVSMSNSSVMLLNSANTIGSVTALQGTNPWLVAGTVGSSIVGTVPVTQVTSPWLTKQSTIGIVDAANSTASAMAANASFVGATIDAQEFAQISLSSFSDVASGPAGLQLQWSSDGTNFDHIHSDAIASSTLGFISGGVHNRYYRTAYYNGSVAQATFRLQTYQSKINTPNEFVSLDFPLTAVDHAQVFKGLITGKTTAGGGSYVDVKVNPSGAISAAVTAADGDVFVRSNAATTFPVSASVIGTVPVTQVTNPWTVVSSIAGGIFPISGSVSAVITNTNVNVSGSVAAFISGSTNASVIAKLQDSSIIAIVAGSVVSIPQGSVITVSQGSIATVQMGQIGTQITSISGIVNTSGSIAGTYTSSTVATTVTGLAVMFKPNVSTSIMTEVSPTWPLPVTGSIAALQGTNPWTVVSSLAGGIFPVSGSVAAVVTNNVTVVSSLVGGIFPISGSVAAVSTNIGSVITVFQNSSLFAVQAGTWIASVVSSNPSSLLAGVYTQRNDTVASFLGADLTWRPLATDSAGRVLVKHFSADESRLDTQTSVVSTSVTALFNSVVGLRNYVTDVMVANTGSVATLVTFKDGSTSILGYTIAPAGGGSNIVGMVMPFRTAPAQDFVFSAGTASSVLYVSAKGYKAP